MTQQDSDDTVANKLLQRTHLDVAHQHVANEVLHLLESGQTNIAAIAFALQDYQEPLLVNFKRLNHLNKKKTPIKKTQEAPKKKMKRPVDDTLVYNILQQYSNEGI